MGSIPPGMLYRSSHPIKDYKEDPVIVKLATEANIKTIINLHDSESWWASKFFISSWYDWFYIQDHGITLGMDFCVTSKDFRKKLKKALKFIINKYSPYLIHCHAGVDRTGFVCMVIESFMGAKLDDVINDYLKSFDSNLESGTYIEKKPDKLTAMRILQQMSKKQIITDKNLQQITENYLMEKVGLDIMEINYLRWQLSGKL